MIISGFLVSWSVREGSAFVANGKTKCKTIDEVINKFFIRVGMELVGEGGDFQWGVYGT